MKELTKSEALKLISQGGNIMFKPNDPCSHQSWKLFCRGDKTVWAIFATGNYMFTKADDEFVEHFIVYSAVSGENSDAAVRAYREGFGEGKRVGKADARTYPNLPFALQCASIIASSPGMGETFFLRIDAAFIEEMVVGSSKICLLTTRDDREENVNFTYDELMALYAAGNLRVLETSPVIIKG